MPTQLDTPGKRAIYNSLRSKTTPGQAAEVAATYTTAKEADIVELALEIDKKIKSERPDDWRDNGGPKEQMIKMTLYGILQDIEEVERIFPIVKQQSEY
ncbi:MAG: hypothetical protein HC805_07655 [Alkalinema sp. RL_2_19]|nr:hypothetical protein [Alkalinema sp. RL_2_19]